MDASALDYVVTECKALLDTRFPDGAEHGAAAMLLEDWADELPESAATLQRRARAWRAHLN